MGNQSILSTVFALILKMIKSSGILFASQILNSVVGSWSGHGHLREDPGPPVAPCTPETLHKFNIVVLKLFRCKVTRQDDTWMENLDGLPDLLLPGLFLLRRPGKQLSVRRRWTKQRDCSSYCFISAAGKQKFVQQVQRCSSSS